MTLAHWCSAADGVSDDSSRPARPRLVSADPDALPLPPIEATAIDPSLVARVREGDEAAFRELFLAWWTPLVAYAARIVRAPDVAADVVQEFFTHLWTHRTTLTVPERVRAYLYAAVRARALNVVRHERVVAAVQQRAESPPGMSAETPPMDVQLEAEELRATLRAAMEALPERGREVALLRWYDGLSYAEIATILSISEATVNVHLTRSLAALRTRLANQ